MTERVDVVVLGMGVGGEEVANSLAESGLNVVGIESNLVGGECPYFGCIPTKMMVRGAGRLAGLGKVSVNGPTYEASRAIVIATGTSPAVPPIPGLDRVKYWTNRDAVKVEELPESLVILGGGAIGVELSQVFARFGVKVSIIEGMNRVLAFEEPEASAVLGAVLQRDGIALWLNSRAQSVEQRGDAIAVKVDGGRQVTGKASLVRM